jgi:hypothetical protein
MFDHHPGFLDLGDKTSDGPAPHDPRKIRSAAPLDEYVIPPPPPIIEINDLD